MNFNFLSQKRLVVRLAYLDFVSRFPFPITQLAYGFTLFQTGFQQKASFLVHVRRLLLGGRRES